MLLCLLICIQYGDQDVHLSAAEQLVDKSQTRAIADAMRWLQHKLQQQQTGRTLLQWLQELEAQLDEQVGKELTTGLQSWPSECVPSVLHKLVFNDYSVQHSFPPLLRKVLVLVMCPQLPAPRVLMCWHLICASATSPDLGALRLLQLSIALEASVQHSSHSSRELRDRHRRIHTASSASVP